MSPQRRSALVSVVAAAALVVLKLSVGLATHSLGLVSEAAHSGTDLVAALLTFFAIRVSARPADVTHQFGHGKAEHLSALAEAGFLVVVSLFISLQALQRLAGSTTAHVSVTWYALVVVGLVLAIDSSRTVVSFRTSRRYNSPALASNALHFASDFLGSAAVLAGLLAARDGHPKGDAIAKTSQRMLAFIREQCERFAPSTAAGFASRGPDPRLAAWVLGAHVTPATQSPPREERCHEIRARMNRLRDEPEAVRGEADRQLEHEGASPPLRRRRALTAVAGSWGAAQRLPRRACSRSIASNSALKLPSPKPRAPWRSITSKNSVGRSCTVFVKIWSR